MHTYNNIISICLYYHWVYIPFLDATYEWERTSMLMVSLDPTKKGDLKRYSIHHHEIHTPFLDVIYDKKYMIVSLDPTNKGDSK